MRFMPFNGVKGPRRGTVCLTRNGHEVGPLRRHSEHFAEVDDHLIEQWEDFIHPRANFSPESFDFPIWDYDGDAVNLAARKLGDLVAVEVDRVEEA